MLDGLDSFVKVVEAGSFSAAAEELERSTSFVSKEVTRLENRLGTRLLNRTTRSISLTEAGRLYFERCRDIVSEAEQAALAVMECDSAPRGRLKVSAPASYGHVHLAKLLPQFLKDNPAITLDISFSDSRVDVVADGYDVVLRIGALKDTSLIARRLAVSPGWLVASPDYWATHGMPEHPSDLVHHKAIVYALTDNPGRWDFSDGKGGRISVDVTARVICNTAELERDMALAGLGVSRIPYWACQKEIEDGRLVKALDDFALEPATIYALYPHRRHLSPKVRAFVDFLSRNLPELV
ncbi:LysR family transcriptional regulator [Coralliovum pocilloporae]|uniref:LysR family transcriptional regulator n=1 Tax=Coralliovum pocilloporae TaxID=3066369 RepID=UPI003306C7FA